MVQNVKNNEKQYRTVFRFFAATFVASAQSEAQASPESVAALKSAIYKPILDSERKIFDSYSGGLAYSSVHPHVLAEPSDPLIRLLASDPRAFVLLEIMHEESKVIRENVYITAGSTDFDSSRGMSVHLARHAIDHLCNSIASISRSMKEISSSKPGA